MSLQRNNVVSITASSNFSPTSPIFTWMSSTDTRPVRVDDLILKRTINVRISQTATAVICSVLHSSLHINCERGRSNAECEELASFAEGGYALADRKEFDSE